VLEVEAAVAVRVADKEEAAPAQEPHQLDDWLAAALRARGQPDRDYVACLPAGCKRPPPAAPAPRWGSALGPPQTPPERTPAVLSASWIWPSAAPSGNCPADTSTTNAAYRGGSSAASSAPTAGLLFDNIPAIYLY
jgi:hypothetical protein